jgi:hypothetical protein
VIGPEPKNIAVVQGRMRSNANDNDDCDASITLIGTILTGPGGDGYRATALEIIKVKRLISTFVSAAAVCAVVSATPAVGRYTVTGAPRATPPGTAEGYGTSIAPQTLPWLIARVFVAGIPTHRGTPARPLPQSARLRAVGPPQPPPPDRCHVTLDFNDAHARDTVICTP